MLIYISTKTLIFPSETIQAYTVKIGKDSQNQQKAKKNQKLRLTQIKN
jgi:hypothetical protein